MKPEHGGKLMDEAFENEIRELLASGNKIPAIKRYREETGAGLAEAKTAVESLEASGSLPKRDRLDDSELTSQVVHLLGRGEMIQAVKLYREQSGLGLKQSREAVQRIANENGIAATSGVGCFGVVLLGFALVTGLLT
ncbi:MAG: hypothetical protein WAO83_12035 [Fuerstiella sp.]